MCSSDLYRETASPIDNDIGSISTNIVLIDENRQVVAKYYLMTASRPIEAVRAGFRDIRERYGERALVRAAAATGSGRHLIGDLINADVVVNEITAHATAATFVCPEVDTIFEIGGQDSKYVRLDKGLVRDFTMNKATPGCRSCARSAWRACTTRSEERRVGKECRSRWSPYH